MRRLPFIAPLFLLLLGGAFLTAQERVDVDMAAPDPNHGSAAIAGSGALSDTDR